MDRPKKCNDKWVGKEYRVICTTGYHSLEFTLLFFMNSDYEKQCMYMCAHMCKHARACAHAHTDICSLLVAQLSKLYRGVGNPHCMFLGKSLGLAPMIEAEKAEACLSRSLQWLVENEYII